MESQERGSVRRTAEALLSEVGSFLRMLYRIYLDPRVSRVDKALLLAAIAYVITPTDLIPDFLGMAGRLDDLYLLGLVVDRLLVRSGPDVLLEHWDGRPGTLRMLLESLDGIARLVPGPVRRVLSGRVHDESAT